MPLYEPIFEALNARGVRYLVVGGLAVVLHGYARLTVDLDLMNDPTPEESLKAVTAPADLGFRPRLPVEPEAFADPRQRRDWVQNRNLRVFSMFDPTDPLREVDLFVDEPMPFEELWARSVEMPLATTTVRVISRRDLIEMKRMAGRARDHRRRSIVTDDADRPEEGWKEQSQRAIARGTTPARRLAWLEEAVRIAHQSGALARARA
ncbi:MAG: hypothetical protein ACRDKS_09955, partial [Actinomycetota bacterium]